MKAQRAGKTEGLHHPFPPVADAQAQALVLGSFPSVKSRETAFYYGHPQNRFWRLLALLFSAPIPETIEEKTVLLHHHHIALWDVVSDCDITGSADSSLTPYALNDIASLLHGTQIRHVFANGQKAGKLYQAKLEAQTGLPIAILPSTSPANAAWSLERLAGAWQPLCTAVGETGRKMGDFSQKGR